MAQGQQIDLKKFPGADFHYKMVAKIDGTFWSIYDANTEYKTGEVKHQQAKPNKKGGYYVYKDVKDALFADVVFHAGGHFTAPRTVLKCICWGSSISYGNKLCYSFLLPVADLGLPIGYKVNARDCVQQALQDKERRQHQRLEQKHDINLVRLNNFSLEQYENNTFENYFSASVVRQVEQALLQDRVEAELAAVGDDEMLNDDLEFDQMEDPSPLRGLVSDIESRYR